MKKLTALLMALAMSFTMISCGQKEEPAPSASKGDASSSGLPHAGETLVVQVWGGTYEETLRNHVIPAFEKKTGATVEVVSGAAPLSQLATEGNEASIDVIHVDTFEVVQGTDMGVLEELDISKLTNASDLYQEAFMFDTAVVTNWGTYGLVYRSDLVPKEPTSWMDIWDPAYADGKVGMVDYSMGGGMEFLEAISRIQGSNIEDTANWDNLFNELQPLKNNIGVYASQHSDLESGLSKGKLWISVETNGRAIGLMKEGYPIKFCQPKEGSIAMTSLAAISKGSTNKDLAYMFLDELLSTNAQKAYAENNYYAPSNSKTVINEELQGFMPYGQEQVSSLIYMDSAALESVKPDLIERWNREFK